MLDLDSRHPSLNLGFGNIGFNVAQYHLRKVNLKPMQPSVSPLTACDLWALVSSLHYMCSSVS